MKIAELEEKMSNCYQFQGINMLDHGKMVNEEYHNLIEQLKGGQEHYDLPP
jgi:hypothetical protein